MKNIYIYSKHPSCYIFKLIKQRKKKYYTEEVVNSFILKNLAPKVIDMLVIHSYSLVSYSMIVEHLEVKFPIITQVLWQL